MSHRVVPKWALATLEADLPPDAGLLNVIAHSRNLVIANTHLGAVAVSRRPFGAPSLHLLPNPRERTGFRCSQCEQALEFRELALPASVHCGWCGHQFQLDRRGTVTRDWPVGTAPHAEENGPSNGGDSPATPPHPLKAPRVRCAATIHTGGRCRLTARHGADLCHMHANPSAATAAELAARALASANQTGPYNSRNAAKAIGQAVLREAPEWANLEILAHDPQVARHHLERLTSTFVNAAAHELRTPMTPLLLSLRTLQNDTASPEKQDAAIQVAVRSAKRLDDVVARLVRVSMVQAGQLQVHPEPVDLAPLLSAAGVAWNDRANSKGVHLHCRFTRPLSAVADAQAVTEVMNHLLSNAIRYSKPGGHVKVMARRPQSGNVRDGIMITVSNEGFGIPVQELDHIFEPFVQLEPARFQTEGGFGLGLFFARALAQAQNGSLVAKSEGETHGATLEWNLPTVVQVSPEAPASQELH